MKAAISELYGPPEVVVIRDIPTPEPKDNEIRIKVHATTVNSGDVRLRALRVPRGTSLLVRLTMGLFKLKQPVLGMDVAGEVESVGKGVRKFKPGDRLVASRGFGFAGHAEFFVVPEGGAIARVPEKLGYAEAVSLLFGGATALDFLQRSGLRAGESILINGASGAVGTAAVQIAKDMGAEVTAVCSASHADLVRSLGADHVIDYGKTDFTRGASSYDVIMDTHGNAPFTAIKHLLNPGGRFLLVIGDLVQMLAAAREKAIVGSGKVKTAVSAERYGLLMDMAARGTLKPVIDSTYSFGAIVEAHRRVDSGHKAGSVLVTLA